MEDFTNVCCGDLGLAVGAHRDSRKRKPNVKIKTAAEDKTTAQRRNSLILSCVVRTIVPIIVPDAELCFLPAR
jgi:hypothetical protein